MKLIFELNNKLYIFELKDGREVEINLETEVALVRSHDTVCELDFEIVRQMAQVLKCK